MFRWIITSVMSVSGPTAAARRTGPLHGRPKPSSAFLAAHKEAEASLAAAAASGGDATSSTTTSATDPKRTRTPPSAAPRTFSDLPKKGPEAAIFHKDEGAGSLHPKILQQARRTGQLNLSGRGLTEVPERVWTINDLDEEERRKVTKGLSLDRVATEDDDQWWDHVELTKLILASNSLTSLSPRVGDLLALVVLDLHDNALESLPQEIGKLENLARLNLNHNRLRRLPADFFSLRSLRSLTVANNCLIELHDDISRLDELETLDLSHNELSTLPPSIGYLTKVTSLNLAQNRLRELPSEVSFLRDLATLELTNNCLEDLPDSMSELGKLERLHLRHNALSKMPNLRNCSHLKEMHLGNNRLTEVTAEDVKNVPNVAVLDLRDNKVNSIPDEMADLQSLQRLDLVNNDLHSVPPALGTLPHLNALSLEGNPIKTIRRDIIQRGTAGLLKYLRSRLTEEDLESLREKGNVSPSAASSGTLGASPPAMDKFALRNSRSLNLSKKELSSLPGDAAATAAEAGVTAADLSKNRFESVPEELTQLLPELFELNLSGNRISSLPGWVGSLGARLQYLDLGNNALSELPPELAEMHELREVALPYNRFAEVPPVLYVCAKLENIVMCGNQVETTYVRLVLKSD